MSLKLMTDFERLKIDCFELCCYWSEFDWLCWFHWSIHIFPSSYRTYIPQNTVDMFNSSQPDSWHHQTCRLHSWTWTHPCIGHINLNFSIISHNWHQYIFLYSKQSYLYKQCMNLCPYHSHCIWQRLSYIDRMRGNIHRCRRHTCWWRFGWFREGRNSKF